MRLLVDTAVLSGQANSLPLDWLADFDCIPFAPRDLSVQAPGARDADAILVRTATRLGAQTLTALPKLEAVATLSSGTDHIDVAALTARGLPLHTGHGGNAQAVADWVQWALTRLPLQNRRVLLVGVGAVGLAVWQQLQALGFAVTLCDPPRAEHHPDFAPLTLDQALRDGPWGAISLHVPKVLTGPHATSDLLNRARLLQLHGAVVLNAARGGVLDEEAALHLRMTGHLGGLAIDTFVGEPQPRRDLLAHADLATPHIAGHSLEGKLRVAHRAVTGLRRALNLPPPPPLDEAIAAETGKHQALDLDPQRALDAVARALRAAPADFEAIRHAHRRLETPATAQGQPIQRRSDR